MLKIWGRTNSINVQKVLWTVDELGLDYQRIDAGLHFGVVTEDWFANINPNRTVPSIDDDGTIIWESNAIIRYLAAKYSADEMMPDSLGDRAIVDMWMDWQQTVLMPSLGPLFMGLVRTAPENRDPAALDQAASDVADGLLILDQHLAGQSYILGAQFTAADIPLGCAAYRWYTLDVKHGDMPNLKAWYDRLATRPAFAARVMLPLS
jgi:glutathione S-transferase